MGLIRRLIPICLLIFFITGCAAKENKKPKTVNQVKRWQELADRSKAITPVPSSNDQDDGAMLEDMAEPLQPDGSELSESGENAVQARKLPTMPITMNMNDVSLPVLLRSLAKIANLDIIINDSVKGKTQISVTSVPWDQLFLGLLDTFGITYEWSGDILQLVSVEDLKRKQALLEARQNYENTKKQHSLAMMQLEQKKNPAGTPGDQDRQDSLFGPGITPGEPDKISIPKTTHTAIRSILDKPAGTPPGPDHGQCLRRAGGYEHGGRHHG